MTGQNSFRLTGVLVTLILVFLSGCTNQEKSIERAMADAKEYADNGDTANAIRILEEINEKYPDQLSVLEEMAFTYVEAGEHIKAANTFARIAELESTRKSFLIFAAQNYIEAGEQRSAIIRYQQYLSHFPEDADSWRILGDLQRDSRLPEDAINSYTRSHELQPRGPTAMALAQLFGQLGNSAQAETWYRQALAHDDGEKAAALLGLLDISLNNGDYGQARQHASELESSFPVTFQRSPLRERMEEVTEWEARQADLVQALREQAALTEEFRQPPPALPLGEDLANAQPIRLPAQSEAAEQPEQEAIDTTAATDTASQATGPKTPLVSVEMADALALPAETEEATSPTVEVDISPEMADTEATEPEIEIAQLELEEAINNLPQREHTFSSLIDKARDQRAQQDFTAAAKTYWQALLQDDRQAEIWFELSESLFKDNQIQMAEKTALEALRRNPDSLLYTINYLQAAQYTLPERQFIQELRRAEEKFPENAEIMLALARAYRNIQRDYRSSAEMYRQFLQVAPNHPQAAEARQELNDLPTRR